MTKHIPVLLPEVVKCLDLAEGEVALDCTLGSGGYAEAITTCLGDTGTFVGLDADRAAVEVAKETIKGFSGEICLKVTNFRNLSKVLEDCRVKKVDAVVFDLGFRSEQLEMERGFSFNEEAPLEMTFRHPDDLTEEDVTAYDIVNNWDEETIVNILDGYGNETHCKRIVEAILTARSKKPIETTSELVSVIKKAVPVGYRKSRLHPATRTFQALRMAVNDEVNALKEGLVAAFVALKEEGRLVVVSFHSVEDRIVKKYFSYLVENGLAQPLTDRPITPKEEEVEFNRRSRSSKLRAVKKCPTV